MRRVYLAGLLVAGAVACGKSESPAAEGGGEPGASGAGAVGSGTATGGGGDSQAAAGAGKAATGGASGGNRTAGGGEATGGAGGSNPALRQVKCSDLTGHPDLLPSPFERIQVTGNNGTFIDECDANGDVVEHHCPMQQLCGGGMDCAPYPTGVASPRTVDCESGCADGVCQQ